MKTLAGRIWSFLRGLAQREESPEGRLNGFVAELNRQVADMRKAATSALTTEKRLRMELQEIVSEADGWHRRALLALEEGDEELAGQALLRKERCMARSAELKTQWSSQRATAEALKKSLHAAMARVEKAKRECNTTLDRLRSAEAQKKIAESLDTSSEHSPLLVLEDLNTRILELEAETEATLELSGDSLGDELEERFSELETRRRASDSLQDLKNELRDTKTIGAARDAGERQLDVD